MHLNVIVSPSVTVFCVALVMSLTPSGLSRNLNQNQNVNLSLFHGTYILPGYKS